MKKAEIIGLLLIILGSGGCRKSDIVIGLNQNIHHDDFQYRVSSVEKRKSIRTGTNSVNARGIFVIVTFVVENDALRVSHHWDNSIAYIESGKGRKYENDIKAQQILNEAEPFNWNNTYITPRGETGDTRLIFDVPADINKIYLKVRGEMLMGDVLNLNKFKRIKIRLY